jgi:hypothetical protein
MGGLQAQQTAIGQLGGVLGQTRGQDQNLALQNAAMRQRQFGIDDQRQLELLRQRLSMNQMQQQGGMGYEANVAGRYGVAQGQPTGFERMMGAAGGLGQAITQMPQSQTSLPYGHRANPWAPIPGGGYQNV